MKKDELIAECKRLGLEEVGTLPILRGRLKDARMKKEESVEDLFKNYELTQSKNEPSMKKSQSLLMMNWKSRVNAILNEYAEKISKKHAIPLELLLKDIPKHLQVQLVREQRQLVIGVLSGRLQWLLSSSQNTG